MLFELGARPYPPRDLYLAYLRQSDVFIGIYGQQYGWIAPDQEISGLEDEYLNAGAMPKLVYVQSPAPDRDPRLKEMLSRIQSDGLSYRGFATSEELSTLIADDLAVLLSERFDLGNQPKEAGRPSRPLPSPASRFIGREREKSIVRDLLTGDLWIAGLLSESVDVVQQALVDEATLSAAERAHARLGLGMLAFGKGDYERAAPALETAIELYSQLGDIGHVATASVPLGVIQAVWAPNGGEDLLSQAADTFRELDDQWGLAFATLNLGGALLLHHRYADAIPYLESASRLPAR